MIGQTISHYKSPARTIDLIVIDVRSGGQNHLRTSFVSSRDFEPARLPSLYMAGGDPDESASADEEGIAV